MRAFHARSCEQTGSHCSGKGVRSAQKVQAGPCHPVGMQLQKAGAGPTSGPAWRLFLPDLEREQPQRGEGERQRRVEEEGLAPGGEVINLCTSLL